MRSSACGESPELGHQGDVDVAVAGTEAGMRQAADEVGADQIGPERGLPERDETLDQRDGLGPGHLIHVDNRHARLLAHPAHAAL